MVKMESKTFVSKLIDIAKNYKTLYVMGCFGAPLQGASVDRYCNNHKRKKKYTKMLQHKINKEIQKPKKK